MIRRDPIDPAAEMITTTEQVAVIQAQAEMDLVQKPEALRVVSL